MIRSFFKRSVAALALLPLFLPLFIVPVTSFALATSCSSMPGLIKCGCDANNNGMVKDVPPPPTPNDPPASYEECGFDDLIALVNTVINYLIYYIASPLAAIMFVYAGFLYMSNRGNEGQVQEAHAVFFNVFWGLIIAIGAWLFIKFIFDFFLESSYGNLLGS